MRPQYSIPPFIDPLDEQSLGTDRTSGTSEEDKVVEATTIVVVGRVSSSS
jgi:hypothetical protein